MQSEIQGKTDPSKEGGDASMANLWRHTGEENVRHVSGRERAEETKMQHFLKTMTNINPRNSGLSNRINTKTINTNKQQLENLSKIQKQHQQEKQKTPRHILKLLKIKDEEKILMAAS